MHLRHGVGGVHARERQHAVLVRPGRLELLYYGSAGRSMGL
jgi:hypothetical protein